MSKLAKDLQTAIATVVRIQKIMEPSVQTVHGQLKMVPPDIQAMRYISQNPDCMSGAVAGFLGVVPTTMTSIIDRLVKRGFVNRNRPDDNRRSVALRLTDEGQRVFDQLEAEELATSERLLAVLPQDEQAGFVRSMQTIASALSNLQDQTG